MEGGMTRKRGYLWLTILLTGITMTCLAVQPNGTDPNLPPLPDDTLLSPPSETISATPASSSFYQTQYPKKSLSFELNTADSLDLVQLYNIGPVIARRILKYRSLLGGYVRKEPPTYGIYMARLVFDYVASLGGVDAMETKNIEKANLLYDFIDQSEFYSNPVSTKADRSICNIPFVTPTDELDKLFNKEALEQDFKNIKGHRSVGGMRASIYNAFPLAGVEALVAFMKAFEEKNKG